MARISVIIAAYNAERTLRKCLNSIKEQSYKDFEIIVVNDGSIDSTEDICNEYVFSDSRFKTITIANGGVSNARNVALDLVQGDWITFVDADDWLEPTALETLYRQTGENVDMVCANFFFDYPARARRGILSKSRLHKKDFTSMALTAIMPDVSLVCDDIQINVEILAAAWGKLIRRFLIEKNHLHFEATIPLGEDTLFNSQCYLLAKDVVVIDSPIYHYVMFENSAIQVTK